MENLLENTYKSINQWGYMLRSVSPHPPFVVNLSNQPCTSFHADYLSIPSSSLQEASTCPSHELHSSTLGYPFQRQPVKQDQLLGNMLHARIAGVVFGRLCW